MLKSHNFWLVRERASERLCATPYTCPHIATLCFSLPRPKRANLRKCMYIASSATRTQAAVLLQQQQSTSSAGAEAQRESAHTPQVWFKRLLSADLILLSHHGLLSSCAHNVTGDYGRWCVCLSQDQAKFTKLQADFSQAQREIEAKDKQIVSLLRRANGSSEVKGFCMFSDYCCLAIRLFGDRGAEDSSFYSVAFLFAGVAYAKIRVKRFSVSDPSKCRDDGRA